MSYFDKSTCSYWPVLSSLDFADTGANDAPISNVILKTDSITLITAGVSFSLTHSPSSSVYLLRPYKITYLTLIPVHVRPNVYGLPQQLLLHARPLPVHVPTYLPS